MGIRIERNTWRTPLQLIDSWLPLPSVESGRSMFTSATLRFARAGWLGRINNTVNATTPATACRQPLSRQTPHNTAPAVRALRSPQFTRKADADTRVVLSGSIADVCAELERLAAMEPSPMPAHH